MMIEKKEDKPEKELVFESTAIEVPEGIEEGGEFEVPAKLRWEGGNTFCVVEANGNRLGEYKKESENVDLEGEMGSRLREAAMQEDAEMGRM